MRSRVEATYAAGAGLVSTLLAAYMHHPGYNDSQPIWLPRFGNIIAEPAAHVSTMPS